MRMTKIVIMNNFFDIIFLFDCFTLLNNDVRMYLRRTQCMIVMVTLM